MTTDRTEAIRALEQEVGVLIRRVCRVIVERALAVHASLQPSAYLLLSYIGQYGPVRASEAAEVLGIDKAVTSRRVSHLEGLGLILREVDPQDGRATRLSVTADGARRLRRVGDARRQWLDERLGDWSDDEVLSLVAVLRRYNRALE